MLVRNNTKCPFCGKISAVDVHVPATASVFNEYLVVRAECYDCLGFRDTMVHSAVLRCWIRELAAKSVPSGFLQGARRWDSRPRVRLTRREWGSLLNALAECFQAGFICETRDSGVLRGIIHRLQTSTRRIDVPTWELVPYAWCRL